MRKKTNDKFSVGTFDVRGGIECAMKTPRLRTRGVPDRHGPSTVPVTPYERSEDTRVLALKLSNHSMKGFMLAHQFLDLPASKRPCTPEEKTDSSSVGCLSSATTLHTFIIQRYEFCRSTSHAWTESSGDSCLPLANVNKGRLRQD